MKTGIEEEGESDQEEGATKSRKRRPGPLKLVAASTTGEGEGAEGEGEEGEGEEVEEVEMEE